MLYLMCSNQVTGLLPQSFTRRRLKEAIFDSDTTCGAVDVDGPKVRVVDEPRGTSGWRRMSWKISWWPGPHEGVGTRNFLSIPTRHTETQRFELQH